jgi:IS5 family transposase
MSFFLARAMKQVVNTPTMKLHGLVYWRRIEPRLVGLYRCKVKPDGSPERHSPRSMFKMTLLGQWHHLSVANLGQGLNLRLHLLLFCDFDLGAELPAYTTIGRVRNRLVRADLD